MPETIKYVPTRKCIACNQKKPQAELIRIACIGSELTVDEDKKNPGRGCYLCNNPECIEKALKKNAFSRSFRRAFPKDEIEKIGRYLNAK